MKIIFVCLGNICRSPLAEGIARYEFNKNNIKAKIYSAGTSAYHNGEKPCYKSIRIAKKNNINISNLKSQHINEFDLKDFDMVIAMDENNINDLRKIKGINLKKIGNFGLNGEDIPDPYYMNGDKGMQTIFDKLQTAILELIKTIKQ